MNRTTSLLLSLLLLVMTLGACSGSDGSGTPDAGTPDAAEDVGGDTDPGDVSGDVAPDATTDAATDTESDTSPDASDAGGDAAPDAVADAGPDGFFDPDVSDGGDGPVEPGGPVGLTAIDPVRGPVTGGTQVIVFGYGFTPETEILINGRRLENFDFVDEETVLGRVPANPAGTWDVKAIGEGGDAVLEDAFTYFDALSISSLEPATGPARGGLPVTLRGTGFTDDVRVSVEGRLGIDVRYINDTTIEFVVPPGEVGLADVRVTSVNGSVLGADLFQYYEDVTIRSVVPAAGSTAGGDTVNVVGSGFDNDTQIYFGDVAVPASLLASTVMRVTVPPNAAGFVDVRAEPVGRLGDTLVDGYFYVAGSGEGIDAVLPASGPVTGDTMVTVAGRGLDGATGVRFGSAAATVLTQSSNAIVVWTPAGTVGLVDVVVERDEGNLVAEDAFRYEPALALTSVSPATGPIEGGTTVTVSGSGFTETTSLRFGAVGARSVRFVNATTLEAVTPPNTLGNVEVVAQDGDRSARLQDGFRYTTTPSVSTMTPTRGSMAGNTYVVIRGAGFDDETTAYFDGIEATEVTLLDPSTLAVRTPPHAPASVPVTVEVGGETLTLRDRFNYFNPFSDALGWWGEPINGAVNVTVIDITTGDWVEGAFVTLHLRAADSRYTGVTDANGQVTISYPDITGRQTISASAVGFSSVTVTNVDAENVIIALASPPPVSPGGGGDTFPQISGTLTGLDKITDPGPNEVLLAVIRNTTDYPGGRNPPGTGYTEVVYSDGETSYPYSMFVRPGDMAVVAICGVYNEVSGEFTPLYMGVQRRVFARMGESYTYDLDCNISMDQFIDFKFVAAPHGPGGTDTNQAIPYLDFGAEGGIDLLRVTEGRDEIITGDHYAPLDVPELEGASYYIVGQAVVSGANLPFSVAYARDIRDPDALVTFGPFMPPPALRYPAAPARQLVERRFEWSLTTSERPDFYYAFITDLAQEVTYWEVWLPGDETSFNLPYFPPGSPVTDLPSEPLVFIVLAIDAIRFDYDRFEFNDFGANNWNSYSANGWVIYN